MARGFSDYRLFWREFRQTFHTTGAILPSGRRLGRALASQLPKDGRPVRILEVGPGTGPVTAEILARMGSDDQLDLVELNESFAQVLRERFQQEASWQQVAPRVRLLQSAVEELDREKYYDYIISGLPLNNFSYAAVQEIFAQFHRLATDGCVLSFFEYVGVRKIKGLVSSSAERQRLWGIDRVLQQEFSSWEIHRQCVLANLPPAWVHHLCLPGALPESVPAPAFQPIPC